MNYRSIWISDVHLGSQHARTGPLLDFLRENDCRYLYLVGDIVDAWELKRKWRWSDETNTVIQKVLRKNRKATKVFYVHGNHDEFLADYNGLELGGLQFAERFIHTAADGKRYLVLHGHQFDGLVQFNRVLEKIGSHAYDLVLAFNLQFNRARRRLGFGYWSLSAYLKFKAKSAVKYVTNFEDAMSQMARRHDVDGIICGHIHRAEMRDMGGVRYLNCGDWVESCTAIAEDFDGKFHLITQHQNAHDGAGVGQGAHNANVSSATVVPAPWASDRSRARGKGRHPELAGLF